MPARLLAMVLLVLAARGLAAQGVTTAAIQGTVRQADGTPVPSARISVTDLSTGRRWEAATGGTGRYLFETVGVGGPYRIDARAVGFAPEAQTEFVLTLGQRLVVNFVLRAAPVELPPLIVTAAADAVLNASRTGPADIIDRSTIAVRPNPGRDFLTLTTSSPHVALSPSSGTAPTGGITIAGQNRLYNSFQIDGGTNHDLYRGRLPGRETLPRPISLEALQEIQVVPAPFDVRHGGFAGGLVNAVTRSGTNTLEGSVFGYLSDAALVRRRGADGELVGDFTTWQFGGAAGGPLIRDRAHLFVSIDALRQVVPDPGPLITDTVGGADLERIGISHASAVRFQDLLRDTFGLDPGTLGPVNGRVSSQDVFGKVTVQLGVNSHLEFSHHYTHGDRWGFLTRTPTFYFLSSFDQRNPSTSNASRLIWTVLLGHRWSNELIVSRLRLVDTCGPTAGFSHVRVRADRGTLVAGAAGACPVQPLNHVIQDVLELTENVTRASGSHVLTVGVHAEALRFRDDWLQNASGQWIFANLDALQARRPRRFQHTLPGPGSTGGLDIRAYQLGAYVQDRWIPTRGLSVTLGLRTDVAVLPDAVATNVALRDSLGIDTGRLPSGDLLWSPRLGVNYDVGGAGRTFVRGGMGLFTGRMPYQWLGSAYRDNGAQELFLDCRGARTPAFDPLNQPTVCADGTGPVSRLSFFDPDVTLPQNLKLALGADHLLPGGVVGTVDVLYTRAVQQLYLTDANLLPPVAVARGEGNRPLYGTISATPGGYTVTPARRVAGFGQVVRVANRSGDHALSVSFRLRKRFGDQAEASAFYAYTRARDQMSVVNPSAHRNLENTPLDGTLEARALRTSYFEIPHRIQLAATVRLPFRAWLSLLYTGASGTPYTHMVQGDANADGIGDVPLINDIMYVPRNRADIALDGNGAAAGVGTAAEQDSVYALLDALIEAESCLRTQRGRILARNSCRNPWFGTLNARVSKALSIRGRQALELTVDVYNVLNLFSARWGQSRATIRDLWVQTLRLVGYDPVAERGVYEFVFRGRDRVQDLASRWQMEVGARYVF